MTALTSLTPRTRTRVPTAVALLAAPALILQAPASVAAPMVDASSWTNTRGNAAASAATEHTFTDSAQTTTSYWLIAPAGQARGLVVYLDGDGQGWLENKGGGVIGDTIVPAAQQRNAATLLIRAPRQGSWWAGGGENGARLVAELVTKVRADLGGISPAATAYIGYSGGSQLLSKYLVPLQSDMVGDGKVLMIAGGGAPGGGAPHTSATMTWVVGSADDGGDYDALSDAQRGQAAYERAGAQGQVKIVPGADHSSIMRQLDGDVAAIIDAAVNSAAAASADRAVPTASPNSTATGTATATTAPSPSSPAFGEPADTPSPAVPGVSRKPTQSPTPSPSSAAPSTPAPGDSVERPGPGPIAPPVTIVRPTEPAEDTPTPGALVEPVPSLSALPVVQTPTVAPTATATPSSPPASPVPTPTPTTRGPVAEVTGEPAASPTVSMTPSPTATPRAQPTRTPEADQDEMIIVTVGTLRITIPAWLAGAGG